MKKVIRNDQGFTLVELMVVVAIIGILSSIAIPNFKKYQAKSKQSEAKIALAGYYSAEVSTQADYDTYATCPSFMGIEKPERGYYITGFDSAYATGNQKVRDYGGTNCLDADVDITPTSLLKTGASGTAVAVGDLPAFSVAMAIDKFEASAVGNISQSTTNPLDKWRINEKKLLTNAVQGY